MIEHVIVTYTEQMQRFIVIGAEMKRSRGGAEYSVFSRCRADSEQVQRYRGAEFQRSFGSVVEWF